MAGDGSLIERDTGTAQAVGGATGGLGSRIEDVGRIAVLRANAIGDFVFALPALSALRVAYPHAQITLLGLDWHRRFLEGRPGPVDRVVALPEIPGVSAPMDARNDAAMGARVRDAFLARMRAERFDLALQLHGGGRHSNPFVRSLRARVSAGLQGADAMALDRNLPYVYFQPEIVRYLEVAGLVGASPITLEPRLCLIDADRREADRVLGVESHRYVLIHPGASDPRRRWAVARFAEVGRALAARGFVVLINGVEGERALCDALADAIPGARNLCGRLSLGGLLGVLERCDLVLSNDTGPLHLAAAVGTSSVGIYWSFNLVNSSQLTRARHTPLASWRTHCPVCARDCTDGRCEHAVSFVDDVGVDAVLAAALQRLASVSAGAPCARCLA